MRIVGLFEDGFECNRIGSKEFIRIPYKIRVGFLKGKDLSYSDGLIEVTLENIEAAEVKEDIHSTGVAEIYCRVYEVNGACIYLSEAKDKSNIFKRMFLYEGKGFITLPELEAVNRFENGDLLKITMMWM